MRIALLISFAAALAFAQQFEVASVKSVPAPRNIGDVVISGGPGTDSPERYRYRGAPLRQLIVEAWDLRYATDQVEGPAWIDQDRFEVIAIMPSGTTKDQFRAMLRNLLTERFHLEVRIGKKQLAVVNLEAVQPKFQRSSGDPGSLLPPGALKADADGFPLHTRGTAIMTGEGPVARKTRNFSFKQMSMDQIASMLGRFMGERLINQTGLEGLHDLRFYVDLEANQNSVAAIPDQPTVTFADAMEQQLGLRLRSSKTDYDVVIIEGANRIPDEN